MKNLTILIYSLASGGAERVVSILLNELKENYNITLVLMNNTIFYDIPNDIKILYLDDSAPLENGLIKLIKLPYLAYKYKKICSKLDINISLSFLNRPNYINTISKIFGNKSKILISERIAPSQEYKSNSLKDKISRGLIKYLYPKANLIIPNANMIAYELVKDFGIKKNQIKVINNPIDLNKVNSLKREEIDFEMNYFTFITIGRLEHQKNHKLMIKAFSKIENISARLFIIGDGELKKELEVLINKLNLTNRVILLGNQNNPYKFIYKANCFILSSNYEGFPNVLLEALACNLPIISTDCISGPREILFPNTSILKKLSDKMEITDNYILVPTKNEKLMTEAMDYLFKNYTFMKKINNSYITKYSKKNIVKDFRNEL